VVVKDSGRAATTVHGAQGRLDFTAYILQHYSIMPCVHTIYHGDGVPPFMAMASRHECTFVFLLSLPARLHRASTPELKVSESRSGLVIFWSRSFCLFFEQTSYSTRGHYDFSSRFVSPELFSGCC